MIANNLPILEKYHNSLPTVRMPREDVAGDRQSSVLIILENCRNIPVVETGLVTSTANMCVGEGFTVESNAKIQPSKNGS